MKLSRIRKLTWKLLLIYALIVVLVVFSDPDPGKIRRWWFWAGLAPIVLGQWLRFWAAGHLSKNKVLTITGPYAYLKNPLFAGTFLIMLGFCALAQGGRTGRWYFDNMNWFLLAAGILGFIFYYAPYKKKREAGRLRELFGEPWDHYDRAVPDYFPRLSRYERAADAPWSWSAVRENSEHWTPLAIAVGGAAIVFNRYLLDFVNGLVR